ncbi:MAG: hypothetical protein KGO50_17140 [Myxococcales bacterium]|nr:hypothetical protein [Myxococcales bacterium]
MDEKQLRWEPETQSLVLESDLQGLTKLPVQVRAQLQEIARAGRWNDHRVGRVVVSFSDETAGRYNADALAFVGLHCRVGGVDVPGANYETRTDFGLKS